MDEDKMDKDEAIFLSIIFSFHAAAMQQMGKVVSPLTGKVERDLEAARGTIDVLVMLRKKTEGNLTTREQRTLHNLVTELQLNFVDESSREAPAKEKAPPAEEAPSDDQAPAAKAGAGEAATAEKEEDAPPEGKEEGQKRTPPKKKGGAEKKGAA